MTDPKRAGEPPKRPSFLQHIMGIAAGCAVGYLLSRFLIGDPILMIFATIVGGFAGSGAAHGHAFLEFGDDGASGGGDGDGGGD